MRGWLVALSLAASHPAMRGWLVALSFAAMGCAEITYGEPKVTDTVLGARPEIAPSADVNGEVVQKGDTITVHALERCELVEMREIKRVETKEKQNDSLGFELALLGVGTIPASFGSLYLVDASNVYESDRNAQNYNPVGPDGARAAGIVLLGVGALIMAVPVVDAVRTIGSEENERVIKERGPVLRPDVACSGGKSPAVGRMITARTKDRVTTLGATSGDGRASFTLSLALPPDFVKRAPGGRIEVWIDQRKIGDVDLGPTIALQHDAEAKRDEEAWSHASFDRCAAASKEDDCAGVRSYLSTFPEGAHAEEARALLRVAERRPTAQVAIGPTAGQEAAEAAAEAARVAAAKAAVEACKKECATACKRDAACAKACVAEACQ